MRVGKWFHQLTTAIICLGLLLQTSGLAQSAPALTMQSSPLALARSAELKAMIPASASAAQSLPTALDQPMTVARTQSRYQAGRPVTVTYTLYNNLRPTRTPQTSGNVTDTVALLISFDPRADMNSLQGISLTASLAAGVTLLDSGATPSQNGNELSWNLPAIPPGASHSFTLTVQPPPSAGDFVDLVSAATVSADLWDTTVSATARPARLAPDSAPAAAVAASAEVDPLDDDMLWFSAKFGQDPLAAFEAVQSMGYEPYRGSLRGTRGTLWSAAGNSLDQASLLIAMLRAAGIPARYKQGALSEDNARTLLASAFPSSPGPTAGYVPASIDVADPVNDPALIAIAQEHWWVEALLPGQGWTQLDPSFPGAAVGQSFASPGPYDGVTAAPTQFQHTLTLSLAVEQYSAFPIGGAFIQELDPSPLFGTFPTAQVAAKRVSFGQFVEDSGPGGAVFGARQIVYQPYFGIEENNDAVLGDPFQDLITNFPLGTRATVAIWIEYEIRDVEGNVQRFRRPIKDLIGPDVRMNGGAPALALSNDSPPFLSADEQYVHWVLPNAVPAWAYERQVARVLSTILEIGHAGQAALALMPDLGDAYTPEQIEILSRVSGLFLSTTRERLALAGLGFAQQTDSLLAQLGQGLKTELFYATPRIFAVGAKLGEDEAISANVDLRTTRAIALVHPGQAVAAGQTAQWLKGVIESQMEGAALEQMGVEVAISAARIFEAMHAEGLTPVLFQPDEIDLLEHYPYSAQGKAYMTQALMSGKRVLAPPQPIEINGEPHLAWWQIDPASGETVSVGEDGLHPSSFEWIVIRAMAEELIMQIFEFMLNKILGEISGGWLGTPMGGQALIQFIQLLTQLGQNLAEVFSTLADAIGSAARSAALAPPDLAWAFLPAHLCPVDNCGVEQFLLAGGASAPIPLPEVAFGYVPAPAPRPSTAGSLTLGGSLPAGAPAAHLTASPGNSTTSPGNPVSVQLNLASNVSGPFTGVAYAPAGWGVSWSGFGQVSVTPPVTAPAGSYTLLVVAQSDTEAGAIASLQHPVTVSGGPGVSLAYAPEPNITVPLGDAAFPAVSNQTNDGEAEIPNAAFRLTVTNPTDQPQPITLNVSGGSGDWIVLNGARQNSATITLPPASQRDVGLYVSPTLPTGPGTGFTMNVQMSGGGSGSVSIPWNMAGQAHNYLTIDPPTLFITPDAQISFELAMQNVGNVGGDFPVNADLPGAGWGISSIQSPVTLAAGQASSQSLTLASPADVIPGQRYRLIVGSPAPDSYTQYALADVRIVSPVSGALFEAALACPFNASLSASLEALALAVVELEYWCGVGDCPLPLRNQIVAAGQSVISYARSAVQPVSLPALAGVESAVADLASLEGNEAILAGVAGLANPIIGLSGNLCDVANHRAQARFTPYIEAILVGDTATYNLAVTNQGSLTTTYAITVAGLPGAPLIFSESIPAGGTINLPVTTTPPALGVYDVTATVEPEVADLSVDLAWLARARLNVVDRFVQVTQVTASPDFVDTGSSSTALQAEVANLAGVVRAVEAWTAILAPGGATVFSDTLPLTLLAGNPRSYALGTVDTSAWAAGIYTVTVDLRDGAGEPVADGAGYGYFSVGQGLRMAHAVTPEFVVPGTVTVSTLITTEIVDGLARENQAAPIGRTIYDMPTWETSQPAPRAPVQPQQQPQPGEITLAGGDAVDPPPTWVEIEPQAGDEGESHPLTPVYVEVPADGEAPESPAVQRRAGEPQGRAIATAPAFTRIEQDDPAWSYTGTWTNVNLGRASGGSHWRNASGGSTAELTFNGAWVSLGFIADRFSGYAEIFMDGASYGIIDLYRNLETPTAFHFGGLSAGPHTLVIEVVGSGNPFASNTRVQLDYADYGDGSLLPDGAFEEDDPRLLTSGGWTSVAYAGASGGSYLRATTGTAWFPFAGDSFTLDSIAHSNGGKAQLFVDGVYLDTIDMFEPVFASAAISRTSSYEGFGPGPHILQIMSYQGQVNIDTITTPGSGPFIDPNPPVSGVTRFEADHPSIRYNGVPFTQTASSWVRVADINANRASAGEYVYSATAGDTLSFSFEGEWLGVGFATTWVGGQAEIAIDGQLMQTVDLYSRYNDTASYYFRDLGAGPHTVTITVLGTGRPEAPGSRVHLDFFDVWDGQPLAGGTFEEDSDRLILSNGWGRTLNAEASGGAFASSTQNVTAWFPFTGDSFTYHGRTRFSYQDVELRLNGTSLGQFDLYSYEDGSRSYSFDDLGAGPHMLEIRYYRAPVTVDALSSPAIGPAYEPPAPAPIVRYEEDHPNMRYNGHPYRTMPQTWALDGTPGWTSSGGNSVNTSTAGNVWSMAFEGEWVNIGMRSTVGEVDIRINGLSQGIFDTSGGVNGVKNFPFTLDPGPHLVEVVLVSGTMAVDTMDVWQGEPIAAGWYDALLENEETGLFHFNHKQWWRQTADIYAYNGLYLNNFASSFNNIWFHFVGTDLTILGNQRDGTTLHVVIDGVDYGVFDMSPSAPFRGQPYALHFPNLGEGAHLVQVFLPSTGSVTSRIDAFEVNPDGFYSYMPEIKWYDTAPSAPGSNPALYNDGLMSTIAIGDLNGDGVIELVAPATNGVLYVYRGDGQDAGGGSPLLWSTDIVGAASEPALADLTGDGRAEIIISGYNGAFAFTHDGTQLWHNPAVRAYTADSGGTAGWGGPTLGNLDLDPEPEIVVAASEDAVYVLDHEGNTLWSEPIGRWPTVPVLADITGDGILDILVAQGWELTVYDYFNGGQVVWTYVQTNTLNLGGQPGAFGSPAVADLTGDGQPEIIINWGHLVEAIRADGTLLWQHDTGRTNLFRPSPITVADVTGDGQMNIVTASAISAGFLVLSHLLMVLDADGALVWEQNVGDSTASASGVAAQDLTGNGAWEIIWNGSDDGLLIIRGSDGKRLFNEPFTGSGTIMEYPTLGDVDGDGVADIVLGGYEGIFVFSHVGRWVDSRPLWNQHNYHVTNINDDWSAPINEPNSWELHNTYRTQTPERSPAPSYRVEITHTVGLDDVTVLADTFSTPPTGTPPLYHWQYQLEWYAPVNTISFDSELADMQPGETRQINEGTEVAYRLPGGMNYLTLPPLYVKAAHLGELSPPAQSVVIGGTAVFTLTLTNPGSVADSYALVLGGVPAAWVSFPATVPLLPGETTEVLITVNVPPGAEADVLPLLVDITNQSGGAVNLHASLTVFEGAELAITPASQTTQPGVAVPYTLTLTNYETVARTYALSATGLAAVDLPADITVATGETATRTITVTPALAGPHPFTVEASAPSGATASDDAVLEATTTAQAALRLSPDPLVTGPGSTGIFEMTLTNRGEAAESFTPAVDLPAGWSYALENNQGAVSAITLPPATLNSAFMRLLITPNPGTVLGSYPVTVRAVAQSSGQIAATSTATVEVIERGVQISLSGPGSISARDGGVWNVQVTNTGSVADSFRLGRGGLAALAGAFSAATVSLAPGASQNVQLTIGSLGQLTSSGYPLSVSATSESDERIVDEARSAVSVGGTEAVSISWRPGSRSVEQALIAQFTLIITNTGSLPSAFSVSVESDNASIQVGTGEVYLPPGSLAQVPVTVSAAQGGVYPFSATVRGEGDASASAAASVTFILDDETEPTSIYLPFVTRQDGDPSTPGPMEQIFLPMIMREDVDPQ